MVTENEGESARIEITISVVPEVKAAAEQTARRHGANLSDALSWWAHLLALAQWLPHGSEAALVKLWFTHAYPKRKDPPCR
jgi:hypothetical protein